MKTTTDLPYLAPPRTISTDWPTNAFDIAAEVRSAACALDCLGLAFYRTGNRAVGDELMELAFRLTTAEEALQKVVSTKISGDFESATAMTGTLMRAVLAGAIVERGNQS